MGVTGYEQDRGESRSASVEELFTVLSNRRRRFTLHCLLQHDGRVDVGTLAEQIAAWENGVSIDEVSYDDRRNVRTALKRTHLRKLDAAGLIEYDGSSAAPADCLPVIDVYVSVVGPGARIPWSQFYAAAGLAFLTITVLRWAEFPVLDLIPPLVWAGTVSVGIVTIGLIHTVHQHRHRLGSRGPPPEVTSTPPDRSAVASD
ncbi:MAG: DUF7344 domain-containing protein [Halococcoides sp.]